MERGVVVGGLLISASLLVALLLNRSALEESARQKPDRASEAREQLENCYKALAPKAAFCACIASACQHRNDFNGHEAAARCSASAAPCECPCSSRPDTRGGGSRLQLQASP
jgi:hypothetical protein